MTVRLSNDDRCAVDLLLEHAQPPTSEVSSCFTNAPSAEMQTRLARVEQLLQVLDLLPAPELPADLVESTLSRCDRSADVRPVDPDSSRPIATAG